MAKFFDKILNVMNVHDYDDDIDSPDAGYDDGYEDSYVERTYSVERQSQPTATTQRFKSYTGGKAFESTPKVVNLQASIQMEVVVLQPTAYDEAQTICDHIKSKRPVILNLEKMERGVAQRIMDFVSGSCYTLNGNIQRITNNIFILAPENIDIAGDFREELKSNGIILPWKND